MRRRWPGQHAEAQADADGAKRQLVNMSAQVCHGKRVSISQARESYDFYVVILCCMHFWSEIKWQKDRCQDKVEYTLDRFTHDRSLRKQLWLLNYQDYGYLRCKDPKQYVIL